MLALLGRAIFAQSSISLQVERTRKDSLDKAKRD